MSDSSNSFWQALPALKERQRRTGLLAALVLGLAVLVLVDGLQALMRAGSYHLDIVAGQGTMLSGPIGIDKPRDSDLLVSVTPEGAPLSFRLDGMWRGEIVAEQGATPGTYALSVRVRGTPASATQRYEVTVWSDAASLRQGAYSLTVSLLGFNPFWLSGILFDISGWPRTARLVASFNPVTWVVQSVRDCFIYNKWFFTDWESFLPFLFVLLIFVVLALHNYHRLYMEVPDVL